MAWFGELGRRLRMGAHRQQLDRDLEEEMRLHRDLRADELRDGGFGDGAARSAARRRFGNSLLLKELSREPWGWPMMEQAFQDVRYGIRAMLRTPVYTTLALATLALGIGANTAIFSVVNAVLLRPLPFRDPNQIVNLWPNRALASISKAEYAALREELRNVTDLIAYSTWTFTLTGDGEPAELKGARTTANAFSMLGVKPLLGPGFLPGADQPGAAPVVLISHHLWETRFGKDPQIIGRRVTIDGAGAEVAGVMPPLFGFPAGQLDLWTPLSLDPSQARDYAAGYLYLAARLKPGVTVAQAQSELSSVAPQLVSRIPGLGPGFGKQAAVVSMQEQSFGSLRVRLLVVLGAVGLVLLIACANVANLQLARTAGRQKEIAIRAANGATRMRLVRQLLTENLLLALTGGVLGVILAFWLKNGVRALLPSGTPRAETVSLDPWVLGFALLASVLTGILFGVAPALTLSRPELVPALKEGGRSSRSGFRGAYRAVLVTMEIALALILVVGAGLLGNSLWRLQSVDPGFRPDNVLSMRIAPPAGRYQSNSSKAAFYRDVLARVRAVPGVAAAGAIHLLPLGPSNWNFRFDIEGRPLPPGARPNSANFRLVTSDYFRATGIAVVRGRPFTAADDEHAPLVAIINEALARQFWPGQDPLGQRIANSKGDWATIVGIVGDVRDQALDATPRPALYRPYPQSPYVAGLTLMVRSNTDPLVLAGMIRDAVWSVDRAVPVTDIERLSTVVSNSVAGPRATAILIGGFAALALLLGIVGVYGVVAFSVAQRTHEIGIRMSLGAQPTHVLWLVMRQGIVLALFGIAAGLAGSMLLTRYLTTLLFNVSRTDATIFAPVAGILLLFILLATYLPTRRAMRVDPVIALRLD